MHVDMQFNARCEPMDPKPSTCDQITHYACWYQMLTATVTSDRHILKNLKSPRVWVNNVTTVKQFPLGVPEMSHSPERGWWRRTDIQPGNIMPTEHICLHGDPKKCWTGGQEDKPAKHRKSYKNQTPVAQWPLLSVWLSYCMVNP